MEVGDRFQNAAVGPILLSDQMFGLQDLDFYLSGLTSLDHRKHHTYAVIPRVYQGMINEASINLSSCIRDLLRVINDIMNVSVPNDNNLFAYLHVSSRSHCSSHAVDESHNQKSSGLHWNAGKRRTRRRRGIDVPIGDVTPHN